MPAYEAEWQAFMDAVTTAGIDVPVTLEDGVAALQIAEAATQSAQSGVAVEVNNV